MNEYMTPAQPISRKTNQKEKEQASNPFTPVLAKPSLSTGGFSSQASSQQMQQIQSTPTYKASNISTEIDRKLQDIGSTAPKINMNQWFIPQPLTDNKLWTSVDWMTQWMSQDQLKAGSDTYQKQLVQESKEALKTNYLSKENVKAIMSWLPKEQQPKMLEYLVNQNYTIEWLTPQTGASAEPLSLWVAVMNAPLTFTKSVFDAGDQLTRWITTTLFGWRSDKEIRDFYAKLEQNPWVKANLLNRARELKYLTEYWFVPEVMADGETPTWQVNYSKSLQHLNELKKNGAISQEERKTSLWQLQWMSKLWAKALSEEQKQIRNQNKQTTEQDLSSYMNAIRGKKQEEQRKMTWTNRAEWLLDTVAWWWQLFASAVAPMTIAWMQTAWQTKIWWEALQTVAWWLETAGEFINQAPWLKQFRDSLPAQKQKEFDMEIGWAIPSLLWLKANKKITTPWYIDSQLWKAVSPLAKAGWQLASKATWKLGELSTKAKERISPMDSADELVLKITQWDKKNISKLKSSLNEVDLQKFDTTDNAVKEIKTKLKDIYEVKNKVLEAEQTKLGRTFWRADTDKVITSQKFWTSTTKNYIDEWLKQMKTYYEDAGKLEKALDIDWMTKKFDNWELTIKDIDNLSTEYNNSIWKAAFDKQWNLKESTKFQNVEGIRKGIRETAREFMGEWAKKLDEAYTNVKTLKDTMERFDKKVVDLSKTLDKRWLWGKLTSTAWKVADVIWLRTLVTNTLLKSDEGLKRGNALGLQENMLKNIKKLQKIDDQLGKDPTTKQVEWILSQLKGEWALAQQSKLQAQKTIADMNKKLETKALPYKPLWSPENPRVWQQTITTLPKWYLSKISEQNRLKKEFWKGDKLPDVKTPTIWAIVKLDDWSLWEVVKRSPWNKSSQRQDIIELKGGRTINWSQIKEWYTKALNKIDDFVDNIDTKDLKVIDEIQAKEIIEKYNNNKIKKWIFPEEWLSKKQLKELGNIKENDFLNQYYKENPEILKQELMSDILDDSIKTSESLIKKVQKIEEWEKSLWKIAWKTIKDAAYKKKQSLEFAKKKERIIEEIQETYNVDQFEASNMYNDMVESK